MAKIWTEQQKNAITYSDRNLLVSAAAGSGKTAVLVERIISEITSGAADIDRLAVVTFTKAAAAEMKERIRSRLEDMAEENPHDANILKQSTLLHNAHISTIDSFCLWIIRNHFSEIHLDPVFRTADEGEMKLLGSDIMRDMLEEYYAGADEDFFYLVDAYGTGRTDAAVENMIEKIYQFARSNPWPDEWYDNCIRLYTDSAYENNAAIAELYESILCSLKDYALRYVRLIEVCESPGGPVMYLDAIRSDYAGICAMSETSDLEELSEKIRGISFESLGRKKSVDLDEDKKQYVKRQRDIYKAYIKKLKEKVFPAPLGVLMDYVKKSARVIQTMVRLAKDYADRMDREKRERNIIDFNDMEHMALNILVKRVGDEVVYTQTADELSEFFHEILIDEYQDSNLLQEVILTAVSRQRFDDRSNNIYMVGDVKQSIYSFRLACPQLFMEKYNSYTKEDSSSQKIELLKNFRSRKNILDCTNDVFKNIMNERFCGIRYDESHKLNAGFEYPQTDEYRNFGQDLEGASEMMLVDITGNEAVESSIEAEGQAAADKIRQLMEKGYYIYDTDASSYRRLEYRDIVILTRTIAEWAETVVNVLMNEGIPAECDSTQGYFKVREIKTVLNMLTIIDNPLQDIPLAAAALSYYGGFTEDELAKIRIYGRRHKEPALYNQIKLMAGRETEDSLALKCTVFLQKLDGYRDEAALSSVYDLVWSVIYNSGFYDYAGSMPAGSKRQYNLDILLARAASYENTSYGGLFNFLRYIERLQKYDVEILSGASVADSLDCVRVMSIHKSKGLEFPVVIMVGLGKQFNMMDARGKIVIDQRVGIGIHYVDLEMRTGKTGIIKAAVSGKIERDTVAEEQRLLYVAMTRAREKLIMCGTIDNMDKKNTGFSALSEEIIGDGVYSYATCEELNNYLDMVAPTALLPKQMRTGDFRIERIDRTNEEEYLRNRDKTLSNMTQSEDEQEREAAKEEHKDIDIDIDETGAYEELPPYHTTISNRKVKVTVSELKQMMQDADYEENAFLHEALRQKDPEEESIVPQFITGEVEKLAGNERGTAYHRVMECLDYSGINSLQDVVDGIEWLVDRERMSRRQAECICAKDIYAFFESDIGRRASQALAEGRLRREQPFVFEYDGQLVQGVIDLYFVEDNSLVIVDYKTDRVAKGKKGVEELKRRYAIQLDYYAKALSQITGLAVKEKIIYAFTLNEEISLE